MRKVLFLTTTLMLLSPAAFAQDSEIVVTGVRTPTPIERLAARVEVIDRAEIETRSLTSLADAIGDHAVQAGGSGQQASAFLRGANSKHALALFDGVRLNDASTPNAQYDFGLDTLAGIARVEVLRGPASAIYGSDALGGVVNQIARRGGEDAFEPWFEAAVGSFETRRAALGAAGEAGDIEYGISAEWFNTEGHDLVPARMVTHSGDPDGATQSTFAASVRRDRGVLAFDALLRARHSEAAFDTFSGGPGFDLRADDPDLATSNDQTLWRLGAEMEGGAALTYRIESGQVRVERDETDGGGVANAAESTQTFLDASVRYVHGDVLLAGGVALRQDEIDTRPQFASPLSADEDQSALYLTGQWRFAERFDASASVRVDDNESFGAETTYALGIVGDFEPLRVFASYGTAFKAPSLSERFEVSLFNIGNPGLQPETSRSYEIGADWRVRNGLTLGGGYYQTRIDDLIDYDFFALQNINIGEAEIDGAEAYLEAAPAAWVRVRVSYDWTDARDGAGDQLARRPAHAWRVAAYFTPTTRFGLNVSWTHVGGRSDVTYTNAGAFDNPRGRVEGFDVGAVAATYDVTERVQAFARIDNITDESYEQPAAFAAAERNGAFGVRARF